jgi:hypothetical protein
VLLRREDDIGIGLCWIAAKVAVAVEKTSGKNDENVPYFIGGCGKKKTCWPHGRKYKIKL